MQLRFIRLFFTLVLLLLALAKPSPARPTGADPKPEPAIPAILAAFDKYEIVAMPVAHGQKDLDDFILNLIRNPRLPMIVNDIAVECGNLLYQSVLDRYIAGEDVPFSEARKVWRDTTQPPCGISEFYETFFPLVRAINQQLPREKRLRVLAADSPINWDQIKTPSDFQQALRSIRRDTSISNVIEKEVLSKHRKALMLFGLFHVLHTGAGFQRDYPNVTFVISGMGTLNARTSAERFAAWPSPSLALAKGTWLGALSLSDLYPAPFMIDQECHAAHAFPRPMQKRMEELVDAFLYLGPPDLSLTEKIPADIVLDSAYMKERQRRQSLMQSVGAAPEKEDLNRDLEAAAQNPIYMAISTQEPTESEIREAVQMCIEMKKQAKGPQ